MPITANVYQRVLRVSVPDGGLGTAFTLDHEEVQYLLTAEHVVAAQPDAVSMTLEAQGLSRDLTVSRLAGVSGGADIAVFRLDDPITQQLPVTPSFDQVVYTQDVYFLGFPYGMGLQRANIQLLPFVKKGILSASAETPGGAHIIYVDGFNNPGFSGGPLVFYTVGSNEPHICGVISGYRADSRQVRIGDAEIGASVLENTGIVVAYDVKHAMDAITAAVG